MLKTKDSRLPWAVSLQGETDVKIKWILLSFHNQQSFPNTNFTIQNLFMFMGVMFSSQINSIYEYHFCTYIIFISQCCRSLPSLKSDINTPRDNHITTSCYFSFPRYVSIFHRFACDVWILKKYFHRQNECPMRYVCYCYTTAE